MSSKLLLYDLETTGVKHWKHCIHQLAALVVIDNEIQESFSIKIRPHEKALIDPSALKAGNVTEEIINQYPHRSEQFAKFKALLAKYVDPYNAQDKLTLVGFCNSSFDDNFLRQFWMLEGDEYYGAFFWSNSIDVSCLASVYLLPDRHRMPSFKLQRVAKHLGITVDDTRTHEAIYDCQLTWEIYKLGKGKNIDEF